MQNNNYNNVGEHGTHVISDNDIFITDDIFLFISKKIFVHHYKKKYDDMDLSLYQIEQIKHNQYPNIIATPHFVRDDGTVIYLQLIQNNRFLKMVQENMVHISMEILQTKNASLYTIELKPSINTNDIGELLNLDVTISYLHITEKIIKYSPEEAKKYTEIFSKKSSIINNCNTKIPDKITEVIPIGFDRNEWISASKTRNYALKDTLVDWLDYCYDKTSNKIKTTKSIDIPNNEKNEHSFIKYIMNKGINFESKVINLIKKKVKQNEFVTICHSMVNFDKRVLEYEKKTKEEILKGTPIIYQSLLMNRTGPLSYSYGQPDLLVRSDYLDKIITKKPLKTQMVTYRASNLKGNYHYVVVDIKFTTLELCADGIRIRNTGSVPAYKCQLYIYNHALGKIQGYEPLVSFILGRKYKFECKKKLYSGNNCFDRFGHIEYNSWDQNYIKETIAAIKWIKTLRTKGFEWKLLPKPSVPELYPNMSSTSETSWNNFKNDYAIQIGEITLLWNCGIKNRHIAHKNGVYTFLDDNCNAENLGINGPKQAPVLNQIININKKRKFSNPMDRIYLNLNEEVNNQWIIPTKLRISVDFETINNVFDDFSELPKSQNNNYLFMIGIAYQIENKKREYKMFLISELSKDAEFQLIYQFYTWLRELTNEHLGKELPIPPLYHWGHIERSYFSNLCSNTRNKLETDVMDDLKMINSKITWFDISESFKKNPIVINGCFKFGLKEIANRLAELELINSNWNNNSLCVNGNTAMIMAHQTYDKSKQTGIPITKYPIMTEIMNYNKIDCIVIHEIIDLMQKKAMEMDQEKNLNIVTKKRKIK